MSSREEVSGLLELFHLAGANESLTRSQLQDLAEQLNISISEADIIFSALDTDNDGIITANDLLTQLPGDHEDLLQLCQGLEEAPESEPPRSPRTSSPRTSSPFRKSESLSLTPSAVREPPTFVLPDISDLPKERQEQVCELYQYLHTSDNPELVQQFESMILGVIKDVRAIHLENDRLEKSFKREKEQHERHLRQLEEEMENQVQKVAERVRKEVMDKAELEKAELKKQLESDIISLQENLKRLQQEGLGEKDKQTAEQVTGLKTRLDDLQHQNRQLKSEVTDSQTTLALIKSELAAVRQQYKEKLHELEVEKETVMDYIKEQDNLTRQLHLLHNANKRLHDTNDDLREALDTSRQVVHKRTLSNDSGASFRSPSPRSLPGTRKGSIMSDYIEPTPSVRSLPLYSGDPGNSSLADELGLSDGVASPTSSRLAMTRAPLRPRDSCEESVAEDIDSGHSTMRDVNEPDTESECPSMEGGEVRHKRRYKRLKPGYLLPEGDEQDSHDEMETDVETSISQTEPEVLRGFTRGLSSSGSRGSRGSLRSLPREDGTPSKHGRSSRRQNQSLVHDGSPTRLSKEPERMYKIVLAGDAAVGKTSFIVRLCKGKFVGNLSSTLGVDFQTKVLEVDNHTVALQLWDTAGQERFRSIAKSYFRRADGVLLLYDCTYERSFLNVRDWVEAVMDGAEKPIPIMLCGNKTDLRDEMEQQGRRVVRSHDGQRLAREFDALFIESSAKEGNNIIEAVIELTRLLRTNEDIEVRNVGMRLHDLDKKTGGSCCKR